MACFVGSIINCVCFTAWTLIYTVPRWEEKVTAYVKPGDSYYILGGYILYGTLVGLHSLSFWKSVNLLGTIPTAVSKGNTKKKTEALLLNLLVGRRGSFPHFFLLLFVFWYQACSRQAFSFSRTSSTATSTSTSASHTITETARGTKHRFAECVPAL